MFKGFYNLTSGMLTQERHLNIVGNNLVNISTSGFKERRYTATTFDDVMYTRVGNKNKEYTDIGRMSYKRVTSEITTTFDPGIPEPTDLPLDFAINGEGFFAVEGDDGVIRYTRSGSFSLDNNGCITYPGLGHVLSAEGTRIVPGTDNIDVDEQGNIYDAETGESYGQLGIYTFEDLNQLERNDQGMFTGGEDVEAQLVESPQIYWRYLERSNTDMVRQMTELLTCQRAFQSAAQVSKIYSDLSDKAANNIGSM